MSASSDVFGSASLRVRPQLRDDTDQSSARLAIADPDLVEGIPAAELALAGRLLVADAVHVPVGPWQPPPPSAETPSRFAYLVLRGVLTREVRLGGWRAAELVGPADLVRAHDAGDSFLAHEVTWAAAEPTTVAFLDERFRRAARQWPSVAATIEQRLLAHVERLAVHVAIAQLPKVELRVLALFWHLADRWGRVTATGVRLPLRLTHEALGRLVGARRPTVTLALADLTRAGMVTVTTGGGWLLHHESRALLEAPDGALVAS